MDSDNDSRLPPEVAETIERVDTSLAKTVGMARAVAPFQVKLPAIGEEARKQLVDSLAEFTPTLPAREVTDAEDTLRSAINLPDVEPRYPRDFEIDDWVFKREAEAESAAIATAELLGELVIRQAEHLREERAARQEDAERYRKPNRVPWATAIVAGIGGGAAGSVITALLI